VTEYDAAMRRRWLEYRDRERRQEEIRIAASWEIHLAEVAQWKCRCRGKKRVRSFAGTMACPECCR
jgi:hypothetical protein